MTAPPRCPNCASLEAQNTELDRKLAELERAHGIIESEINGETHDPSRRHSPLPWHRPARVRDLPPSHRPAT